MSYTPEPEREYKPVPTISELIDALFNLLQLGLGFYCFGYGLYKRDWVMVGVGILLVRTAV